MVLPFSWYGLGRTWRLLLVSLKNQARLKKESVNWVFDSPQNYLPDDFALALGPSLQPVAPHENPRDNKECARFLAANGAARVQVSL
jgi:hypothetical protein